MAQGVVLRWPIKNVFLKILQNSQDKEQKRIGQNFRQMWILKKT